MKAKTSKLPPVHVLIDGSNVLCFRQNGFDKYGQPIMDNSRKLLEDMPLTELECGPWQRVLKKQVVKKEADKCNPKEDYYYNMFEPNVWLLGSLIERCLEKDGWDITLFLDGNYLHHLTAAERRDPEAGYMKRWKEIEALYGSGESSRIQYIPHAKYNGGHGQADPFILSKAEAIISSNKCALIVSNDKFDKPGEAENYPRLFAFGKPPLAKFQKSSDDQYVMFIFPEPYSPIYVKKRDASKNEGGDRDVGLTLPNHGFDSSVGAINQIYGKTALVSSPKELACDGMNLVFHTDSVSLKPFDLQLQSFLKLGTSNDCSVQVDAQVFPQVSGHHLDFVHEDDGFWYVIDVSRNGTYLSGIRLEPRKAFPLPCTGTLSLAWSGLGEERPLQISFRTHSSDKSDVAQRKVKLAAASVQEVRLNLQFSEGRRLCEAIIQWPYLIGRHAGESAIDGIRALLSETDAWGLSSNHLRLKAFHAERSCLEAENLAFKSNGTGLWNGATYTQLPAGVFEWPVARLPFDPTEPHLKLINNEGFAHSRNLQPVRVWITISQPDE